MHQIILSLLFYFFETGFLSLTFSWCFKFAFLNGAQGFYFALRVEDLNLKLISKEPTAWVIERPPSLCCGSKS
jgi:hypothetical protein